MIVDGRRETAITAGRAVSSCVRAVSGRLRSSGLHVSWLRPVLCVHVETARSYMARMVVCGRRSDVRVAVVCIGLDRGCWLGVVVVVLILWRWRRH